MSKQRLFTIFISVIVIVSVTLLVRVSSSSHILGVSSSLTEATILSLINLSRRQQELLPLKFNSSLSAAAAEKARHMVQYDYWSHDVDKYNITWDLILGHGYYYHYAGENLARYFSDSQKLVDAWLSSPPHRANILSPDYTDTGLAIVAVPDRGDAYLIVQIFASPATDPSLNPVTQSTPILAASGLATILIPLLALTAIGFTAFISYRLGLFRRSSFKLPDKLWRTK